VFAPQVSELEHRNSGAGQFGAPTVDWQARAVKQSGIAIGFSIWHVASVKRKATKLQESERDLILDACERTRQACNELTDEKRRRLKDKALSILYGHDAQSPARSR